MANQDDNNNQEIEKVEDVEVETTKNTSDTIIRNKIMTMDMKKSALSADVPEMRCRKND